MTEVNTTALNLLTHQAASSVLALEPQLDQAAPMYQAFLDHLSTTADRSLKEAIFVQSPELAEALGICTELRESEVSAANQAFQQEYFIPGDRHKNCHQARSIFSPGMVNWVSRFDCWGDPERGLDEALTYQTYLRENGEQVLVVTLELLNTYAYEPKERDVMAVALICSDPKDPLVDTRYESTTFGPQGREILEQIQETLRQCEARAKAQKPQGDYS